MEQSLPSWLPRDGQKLNSPIALMRFTLVYDGPLPAQTAHDGRASIKHSIRIAFHKQLRELWHERPILQESLAFYREALRAQRIGQPIAGLPGPGEDLSAPARMSLASRRGILDCHERGEFLFVPLASRTFRMICELDILFLRAEAPGSLFTNGAGDLDNRLKVLFDALRIPALTELPPDAAPLTDRAIEPFFCLLDDDKLITSVRVESDRLLDEPDRSSRVRLVVRVTVKTQMVTLVTMPIEGD